MSLLGGSRRRGGGLAPRSWIRATFLRLLGLFARRRQGPVGELRRILILQLQQLGDTVVFSPTLRAIREHFPDAEIDLLASTVARQLYAKSPHVNEIHRADSWGKLADGIQWRPLIPVIRAIRARRYDCVIADATEHSFQYALMAFLTGARVRLGFNVDGASALFTHRLDVPRGAPLAAANLEIARFLGASAARRPEEIAFDAGDSARVAEMLAEHGVGPEHRIAVLHPGSNWQSKLWDAERFARVADSLAGRAGCRIVFVGTAGETADIEAARRAMASPSLSLVGRTSLTELAALCARAWVFIGTDSGPRNVAGAVGCRTVVVMSAQEATSRWFGYRAAETVIRADARCMGCYFARCAHRLCMAAITESQVISLALGDAGDVPGEGSGGGIEVARVPDALYLAVAGSADADCATLRSLAQKEDATELRAGPQFAIESVTDRPRVG